MPTGLQIFLACGGSTLLALIVTAVWQGVAGYLRRKKESKDTWKQEVRDMVTSVAVDVNHIKVDLDKDKEATVLSLRVQLKDLRDKYENQGYADQGDKSMWQEIYDKYKEMGGNHFKQYVDGWKATVLNLPDTPDDMHDRRKK